jgi:hypothetical protein
VTVPGLRYSNPTSFRILSLLISNLGGNLQRPCTTLSEIHSRDSTSSSIKAR